MAKPQYRTLVKALEDLYRQVDGSVLNACSPSEIRDSYRELFHSSVKAEKLVKAAKLAMQSAKVGNHAQQ